MNPRVKAILENHFSDQPFEIKKEYHSKKNTVALINSNKDSLIVKVFHSSNRKGVERETQILLTLPSKINHPKIYKTDYENNLIRMEYIKGENLCDFLHDEKISLDEKNKNIEKLARWFAIFHKIDERNKNILLKGDAHIRNFIVSNEQIFGVDFEQASYGRPANDIADCCASILLTSPIFTDAKLNWCKQFKTTYQNSVPWVLDDFEIELDNSLKTVMKRRKNRKNLIEIVAVKKAMLQKIIHS